MSSKGWSGNAVRKAREYWAQQLTAGPLPCSKCGRPVTLQMRWHVDHLIPRAVLKDQGLEYLYGEVSNQAVAHGKCNESAGAQLMHQRAGHNSTASKDVKGIRKW